ncbi:ABC transporter ATP-binding protein [Nitrospira sp. M1]
MVTFQHVVKNYVRGASVIRALSDVCLEIAAGQFWSIMGPSGSGKSTVLNLIAGLDVPTSGDILLKGQSTRDFGDQEWTTVRREWLGIVFQAFHLVPGLTAMENVALPLRLQGKSSRIIRQSAENMLEIVGLQERAQHRSSELSGGEQQRVAIARAFVHAPHLILADEPTGNLDSQNGMEIVSLLKRCSQEFGQTVILATHSEAAAAAADFQLTLRDGQFS